MSRSRLIVLGLVVFVAAGFAVPFFLESERESWNTSGNVTVVVTKDYGKTILGWAQFEPSIDLTAMEMLRNITPIETRYGGLFVSAAYGLKSQISKRLDWFYYVNGVYMDRGLASYKPRAGEVVQVDYHYWGSYSASPGFLSGYPAKLVYGLNGRKENITVVAAEAFRKETAKLAARLASSCDCQADVVDPTAALDELGRNLIVLVDPASDSFFQEIRRLRQYAFWPSTIDEGKVWLHGLSGGQRREFAGGYALECTDLPAGRWALVVLATGGDWMSQAIARLMEGQSMGYNAAIAVNASGAMPLPVG